MKLLYLAVLLFSLALPLPASVVQFSTEQWRRELEIHWLLEAETRTAIEHAKHFTTSVDAAGACDGIKDGKYGFHTGQENKPWWQVDLGASQKITRVVVWNRCDAAERAKHLQMFVSEDGKQWRKVYTHDGTPFFGISDGKPLIATWKNVSGRFLRLQLPGRDYLHLDEVEVFGPDHPGKNLALNKQADQVSLSQWSQSSAPKAGTDWPARVQESLAGCRSLVAQLREDGVDVSQQAQALEKLVLTLKEVSPQQLGRLHYFEVRALQRKLAFANPLLNFDKVVFARRKLGMFSHMSDQYYGWWSRAGSGSGIYIIEDFKSDAPRLKCLTTGMADGSFLRPELSFDGRKVIFAYCKFYPDVAAETNKTDKTRLPEDSFYHVYEMNIDGSGVRQLTRGRYNDFDARYLPNGEIVFLSTRRGTATQANKHCATRTLTEDALPDSYVRCGGGDWRPVSVYTLHVMDSRGEDLRAISPFENFEWTPSVANDGRILYSRWDYIDRDNMPYMSLWSTNPDGTNPQLIYGNFTHNPHAVLEARPIPNSHKLIFTASAHHSYTAGSLVVLDPTKGTEGSSPLRRLTPEVCFPESEGWPSTWYASPYPLSENIHLVTWSNEPVQRENMTPPENGAGIYLYDAFGNRDLIYRHEDISSMDPIPLRTYPTPPHLSSKVDWDGPQDGTFMLQNVYDGLDGVAKGDVKSLRIVAVPAKTQPQMNSPSLGITRDDPGKTVLGTVPVEEDGSAYFRVPSGVNVFFQALDAEGMAVQTMRTVTYVQPNQTLSCIGCHESRDSTPANHPPIAASREPSKLTPGPEGSWPLRFDRLVQPVLDKHCVSCHNPRHENVAAAKFDLSTGDSYERLISFGEPSLKQHITMRYREGKSPVAGSAARTSALLAYLRTDATHQPVRMDRDSLNRLVTWMDTYAQRLGSFGETQERELDSLKNTFSYLLETNEDH